MLRRVAGMALVVVLVIVGMGHALGPAQAQGDPDGVTNYPLNMRGGPGVDYAVIAVLDSGTGMIFEARNEDLSWLLGHTVDGGQRGWVAALYLSYGNGFIAANLPLSDEVIAVAPAEPAAPDAPAAAPAEPVAVGAVPAGAVADLPVISLGWRVGEIAERGRTLGNNPHVFTQVGECNTLSGAFMRPFGSGSYDLGPYGALQATIDHFSASPVVDAANSFWYKGVAMQTGLTSMAVTDPMYADPGQCPGGGSPLECDYARARPAIALINLGLYDVYWLSPYHYETAMRQVIEISIERGVIPVLTTFPTCAGDTSNWPNEASVRVANRATFNNILAELAREYGVPLLNLWRATQALPNCGLKAGDHQHLSGEQVAAGWLSFNGQQAQAGFTMWNLVALQMLDALRTGALGG